MRASGVGSWFVAASCLFAASGCVSKGCPPGHVLDGDECAPVDATMDGGGESRDVDRVVPLAPERDASWDEDAGEVAWMADGGADAASAVDAAASADAASDEGEGDACDGGASTRCWRDGDEDGHAAGDAGELVVCDDGCPALWTTLQPTSTLHDCAPGDAAIHPGASELCNDLDEDCDTTVDEGASSACPYAHGSGACTGGVCGLAACEEGYDDCDVDEATGCEQQLDVDGHCGGCGVTCGDLASCGGEEPVGECVCDAPGFGDGFACASQGPLAAGLSLTCGILTDHSVSCWGSGPSDPPSASFRQLALGTTHACGIETNDDVDCWGSNTNGQVKDLVGSFAQVAVGEQHSCALRLGSSILCWGISKTSPGTSGDFGQALDPPGSVYRQITAGQFHNCALKTDDTIHCWGSDEYGQSSPPEGEFVQVTAGAYHTCALRADGSATCWGAGTTDAGTPVHMGQSIVPSGVSYTYLSAGAFHTCAVTASASVVCWGAGDSGTLAYFEAGQSVPVPGDYVRVYAGGIHTCALDDQLKAVCWGADDSGQASPPPDTFPLLP